MKWHQNLHTKTKTVFNRGKRSKTSNEVKSVKKHKQEPSRVF